mgnify:CR=1 FL=1
MVGTVKRINRDRGFAFITRLGEPDVFLHVSGMVDRGQFETLQDGQQVEFEPVDSEKGVRADQVRVLDAG